MNEEKESAARQFDKRENQGSVVLPSKRVLGKEHSRWAARCPRCNATLVCSCIAGVSILPLIVGDLCGTDKQWRPGPPWVGAPDPSSYPEALGLGLGKAPNQKAVLGTRVHVCKLALAGLMTQHVPDTML